MIAGEQDIGDGLSLEFARTCVLRIAEQHIKKRIRRCRRIVAEHARQHARRCIDHEHRRDLPARQHEVPNGDETVCEIVDTRIKALIVSADKNELFVCRQFLCRLLREHLARRIEDDGAPPPLTIGGLGTNVTHGSIKGLGL